MRHRPLVVCSGNPTATTTGTNDPVRFGNPVRPSGLLLGILLRARCSRTRVARARLPLSRAVRTAEEREPTTEQRARGGRRALVPGETLWRQVAVGGGLSLTVPLCRPLHSHARKRGATMTFYAGRSNTSRIRVRADRWFSEIQVGRFYIGAARG